MKYILLLAVIFALAFGSSAARKETSGDGNHMSVANAPDVEGAIINNDRADAKRGYELRQENRHSVAVIKLLRNARRQTGTLTCVSSVKNATCDAAISSSKTFARCRGVSDCHFVGVPGGPPMAPPF